MSWIDPGAARLLEKARTSLWTRPVISAIVGAVLGGLLPQLDRREPLHAWLSQGWLADLTAADPATARAILGTMVGALATVLGVVFSITVVTLQLASTHYTSRILVRFMQDRRTKSTLAVMLGTIAYLLVALAMVGHGRQVTEPRWTMLTALVLSLFSMTLVAFFVHHLSRSIEAARIVASIARETARAVDRLETAHAVPWTPPRERPAVVRSGGAGYVQIVDADRIGRHLPRGATAQVDVSAGDFVLPGAPLMRVWATAPVDTERMAAGVALGHARTLQQDVLFGVRQLVDIALRALSPGMNDVTTAVLAVNELGFLVARTLAAGSRGDGLWTVREQDGRTVVLPCLGPGELFDHAFAEILPAAKEHPRVVKRLLQLLREMRETGAPGGFVAERTRWVQALWREARGEGSAPAPSLQ